MSVVNVVCCQAEVSASGRSLVQKSPTECGVCGCDREYSTVRRPWPTGGPSALVKKKPLDGSVSDASFRCFYLKSPGFITVKVMLDLG
jgi:hypothetical protein